MYRNVLLTALLMVAIIIAVELHAQKLATRTEPELSPRALELLDRRIPNLILHGGTCRQAIEQMRKATGVPISVDWATIPKWDAEALDVELHDIALGDALAYVFRMTRTYYNDPEQIDFEVVDGGLLVTASGHLHRSAMRMRVYDVRDLLTDQYWGCSSGPDPVSTQHDRLDALAMLIESFADSRNWDMQGMRPGSHGSGEEFGNGDIRFTAGRLFVLQTTRGHRQVEAALERLRNGGIPPAGVKKP